jgi:ubiquitin carboxyl-terminal hydrolase 5/13
LEFFEHFIKMIELNERTTGKDPTQCFRFKLEERIQCTLCKRVRYRQQPTNSLSLPVPKKLIEKGTETEPPKYGQTSLKACFDGYLGGESLDWTCPQCQRKTLAIK